ncbi:MAG: hypothetical protein K5874_07460 [Bacteroidaceae bacterium]|nr:hypothetical protein [Bacteroidaceae bacterium]
MVKREDLGLDDTAVVVIKNNESTTKGSASELGLPTKKGTTVANFGAKVENNSENRKEIDHNLLSMVEIVAETQ